jgi:PAS domain S-box-containing protein
LIFAALPLWPTALYARLGAFRRGRWLFVLSGTAAALGVGLLSRNLFVRQMVLLQLMLLTAVGGVTLPLRGLILFLIGLLVGTSAMLGVWPAVPPLQGMGAALITAVIALLLKRLIWRPLSALFQAAQNAELNEAMNAVKHHATGFIYRLSLVDERLTLDFVFGSPENTVAQTPEQLIAAGGWQAHLHPDDRELLHKHWQQALTDGQHTVEYRLRAGSAHTWLWMLDYAAVRRSADGTHVHGMLRNITREKQAKSDLRRYVLQQAVIAELGIRAIQFETLSQLAEYAALCIHRVLDISGCEVYEYLEETEQMALLGSAGVHRRTEKRLSLNDHSLPMKAALAQDYLLLNHIPESISYREHTFFVTHRVQHCLMMSIPSVAQPHGLIAIYRTTARPFDVNEVHFLQSICNILGTFIEVQRSRQQERRHTEMTLALREAVTLVVTEADLESLMKRVLSTLQTLIPHHDASTLMLFDEARQALVVAAHRGYENLSEYIQNVSFKPENSAKYDVLLQNHYVVIHDTRKDPSWKHYPETAWIRSYLGAPILVDGQLVGVINLDSQLTNAFTDADGIILSVFAEKIALAIRNAQRTAELEQLVQARTRDLQAEQRRLRTILEATGDGIVYVEEGITRYVNRALCQLSGYRREELLNYPIDSLISGLISSPADGRTERCEGLLLCKNDDQLPIELTLSGLQGPNAQMVIVVRDVSAQRALQAQQRRFIANAAHELRTPVTNFNTRLYLLEKQPELLHQHLPVLKRIANRMNRLVADLLDSASIEEGRLAVRKEPIVLQTVLQETFDLLQAEAQQKRIHMTLSLLPTPTTLLADGHRLQQVFTNLITNAIHYTPSEGSVSIRQHVEGDYVAVDVADTGIGIDPEHQQVIFEPFYRVETRHVGTGLGLAISKEIVRLHDGRIRLESTPSKGSVFSVLLPYTPTA